ncbi:ABC transporter permease [Rhodobacteraceae bacterium N5(2021)]|uniref:ABC transporter permease n=1 Tax=Gymnodinialimonas phycosphaerae TaxID=2841589 RepID=A0A975TRL9_9RHOB|nr:ABC transporter permease [Gymnodinialimonas phycosphaerae]MBY4893520.1 ABC transporter permease [Gymnodinialimonas phycosphaerae]
MSLLHRAAVPILLLPAGGYLALFFGLPLLLAFLGGFGLFTRGAQTGFTLEHYRALLTTQAYRDGLWFSTYLAIVPTLASLALSLPLAVALARTHPGQRLFNILYKVPLVVPGIVAAFVVMTMFDRGGLAARVLAPVGIDLPKLVRDQWAIGVIIATSWKAVPLMTLIIGGSLASINRDILSAARTLGAGPLATFWRIQVPLALPGITAAFLLTFIGGMGAYAVPNLLGPVYPLPLSVHMYVNAFERNNWGLVSAMGTVLSLISISVLLAYYRVTRGMRRVFGGEQR